MVFANVNVPHPVSLFREEVGWDRALSIVDLGVAPSWVGHTRQSPAIASAHENPGELLLYVGEVW